MESENIVCPVCTLYLRPGMTLKSHLTSHPKQKVIDALVRLTSEPQTQVAPTTSIQATSSQTWTPPPPQVPTNHSFIYQQFMTSTAPQANVLNVNQLGQQYVTIPAVFNSQMMCQPYVYQQQQVIMSSGPPIPRLLRIEEAQQSTQVIEEILDDDVDNHQEPDLILVEPSNNVTVEPDLILVERDDDATVNIPTIENPPSDDEETSNNDHTIKHDESIEVIEQIQQGNTILQTTEPLHINIQNSYESEDHEAGSPCSNASSDYIKVRRDLNKSCQTQPESFENCTGTSSYVTLTNNVANQNESNEVQIAEQQNVLDMDGMNLMLNHEFIPNQIISQVEDFDYGNRYDRTRILLNISESNQEIGDESVSVDSANIRADEHMPPRGELSGQESNASDMAWTRIQYNNGNSGVTSPYNLLASNTWDGSDVSNNEVVPPLENRAFDNDTPTVSGYSDPPIQYKCPTCDENFSCPKERRTHQNEKHGKVTGNVIGSKIGKEKVKKLVIKPKKVIEVKTENNFDNVFTNKLKLESEGAQTDVIGEITEIVEKKEVLTENPVVCTICESIYPDNTTLKQHQFEVHNIASNRYKCAVCDETFSCEPKFTEHLHVHPLECRLCGKYFYRRQNLQLHMKRHLGIRPYKCLICSKSFLTKQKLDEHKNIHTGEAPIKCSLCDETFRRHSNLVQHRNRHHFNIKKKTRDYICSCGEIFHSKKKLAWHKEIHDNKPKSCTHCSEKFIHAASLTRHMRRAHNEKFVPQEDRNNENVVCPICKGIYLKTSLEMHIRNHSGQRPYTCLICNKDFTTKWNLKLHKWTHASRASKPFKCDQCKGAFIRESDYTAHMNSHKSIRPYTCNYCGAQFIRKYNCQRHVKEHEKVKTFKCQICNKTFHRSYYLKDHMRVHSGVRPYSCHICGKTSTTKSNHNKHVRIHHAREPVSTEN